MKARGQRIRARGARQRGGACDRRRRRLLVGGDAADRTAGGIEEIISGGDCGGRDQVRVRHFPIAVFSAAFKFAAVVAGSGAPPGNVAMAKVLAGAGVVLDAVNVTDDVVPSGRLKLTVT